MKILLFVALGLSATSAVAGMCAPLDYQEMKEMRLRELGKEFCAAEANSRESFKFGEHEEFQGCLAQMKRIKRVLEVRGVTIEGEYRYCASRQWESITEDSDAPRKADSKPK